MARNLPVYKIPGVNVTVVLDRDTYDDLKEYAINKHKPLSTIIRTAVRIYLDVQKEEAVYEHTKQV